MDAQAAKRTNAIGQSGLHVAAIWGNLEVALMLIDAGADINAQNQFGVTPLMSAAPKEGQKALDMVRFLVDEGADTLIPAKNGLVAHEVAKTDEMNRLLNNVVPYFRCSDNDVVKIYYFLWSLYLMYFTQGDAGTMPSTTPSIKPCSTCRRTDGRTR